MAFSYNNNPLPSYVILTKVNNNILPPIQNTLLDIQNRRGSYFYQNRLATKTVSIEIVIKSDSPSDLLEKVRELAVYFYSEKPCQLSLNEDVYYLAVLDGSTDFEQLAHIGSGSITFLCIDPIAYGTQQTIGPLTTPISKSHFITGTYKTYPKFTLTAKQNLTYMEVKYGSKSIMLGEKSDLNQSAVDTKPIILNDNMGSLTGWSAATTIEGGYDGSVVGGTISAANNRFAIGTMPGTPTANGWNGPSMVKSLSKQLHDFEVVASISLADSLSNVAKTARISIVMLDANNVRIGKIDLNNMNTSDNNNGCWVGCGTTSDQKIFDEGFMYNKNYWDNFTGVLVFGRQNGKWYSDIHRVDQFGSYEGKIASWTDGTGKYESMNLAKIQVFVGYYGNTAPYDQMWIDDLKVYELLSLSANQIQYNFKTSDVVVVDCEKGEITKNGENANYLLDYRSEFFSFDVGNGTTEYSGGFDVKIDYQERFL